MAKLAFSRSNHYKSFNHAIFATKRYYMIKSMTGFGKVQLDLPGKHLTIEIRSLNSKQLDLNTRIPSQYREKDLDIRNLLAEKLERGKVDLIIHQETIGEEAVTNIDKDIALGYYKQIKGLKNLMPDDTSSEYIPMILRLPEVVKADRNEIDESEWHALLSAIKDAIQELDKFRSQEGYILEKDFIDRIHTIQKLKSSIEPYESERVVNLRIKILSNLESTFGESNYDKNRFEQEMIYYLEKLDITEEKVRLDKHCQYFLDTLKESKSQGKKLGFMVQEIGREINTLGSKANEAHIQRIVVDMKDELEKIKEQLLNIL